MGTAPKSPPPAGKGGLVELRLVGITSLCRPQLAEELRRIYSGGGWVFDELMERDDTHVLFGRQPLVAGRVGQVTVLVKRLYHGGVLALLTRDLFLTSRRLRNQLSCAEFLIANGVPTPETLLVSWRRRLGLVTGEIGVRYIARASDAASHLFRSAGGLPPDWRERVAAVAALTAKLHRLGVDHGDLNLRNFLFVPSGETHILDLDKAFRRPAPLAATARRRNLARLERSIRKEGARASARDVEAIVHALGASYRSAHG